MNVKAFALGFALVLPLTVVGAAEAAPKAPASSLSHVSGTQFGDDIGIAWSFSGKPGQYPRLHVDVTCWDNAAAVGTNTFADPPIYGLSVYLDADGMTPLYPGSGVAYFWTGPEGGLSPWSSQPGDAYCRATLLDWTTQGIRNEYPRVWQTTPTFVLTDPRVAS